MIENEIFKYYMHYVYSKNNNKTKIKNVACIVQL